MPILNKKLLQDAVSKHKHEFYSKDREGLKELFGETLDLIQEGKFGKEESEKVVFLIKMFEFLGYKHHYNLSFEKSTKYGGSIDGNLKEEDDSTTVAIEWKGTDTKDLERSGKAGETPVDQLFRYMSETKAEFGLVGNFLEFRLYSWNKRKDHFQKFELKELVKNDNLLDELVFLLKPNTVLKKQKPQSELENLLEKSELEQEQITKRFYNDYKQRRLYLFQHLVENNPEINKHFLLEKAQKILDRLIFVMFCEDSFLLPANILKSTYKLGKDNRSRSETKIWEQIQYLFEDIDKGRYDINPQINAFNGGLFAQDLELNNLIIKDSIWEDLVKLAEYDFESDLSVNILGHIFEQSISDIEEIKNEIEGESTDNKKSKRKKDGIYYTPEYITDYIVSETIDRWLSDNPNQLENIKVLDPAGGSGAFPNQVHNFLAKKHAEQIKNKAESEGFDSNLVDVDEKIIDKSILKNNIFMVDLQPESVEIAKLSLWLKTAKKDQKLNNLDQNVKCGNSLIDSLELAGERAFEWKKEFPEVMVSGGFDVIVGNPPYVNIANIQDEKIRKYYQIHYKTVKNKSDLYSIFIERGVNLLNDGGYLGYIVSNSWLGTDSFSEFRKFLLKNTRVMKLVRMPPDVFEDAIVTPIILILKKEKVLVNHEIELVDCINQKFETVNHTLSYERIRRTEDLTFSFEPEITFKAEAVRLGDIAKFSLGIKTSNDERFILDRKIDNDCYPILRGRDIERYGHKKSEKWIWYKPELMMEKKGAGSRKLEYFLREKIFIQDISQSIIAFYDNQNYLSNDTLSLIHELKEGFQFKYILAVLNSKFVTNLFKTLFPSGLHIKINQLQQLPIPKATAEQQTQIAELVDQIMALKANSQNLTNSFLNLILAKYKPIIISTKLKNWYNLEITDFLDELKKQKAQISLSEQAELMAYFDEQKGRVCELEKEAEKVDCEIEGKVRELYGVE
jgi:hypothetical protein